MGKIGYIRVSTEHQETARQQEIMCSYQVDRIFSEKLSGANTDRPQLRAMLDYMREGDTLYIESISRLGRSTKDLLNIIDTLNDKGVTLISHKEKIDTDTPTGKFMLTVFAALSQLEREQTLQRQREGIAIAKSQGKYKGRQPLPIDWIKFGQLYEQWKSGTITAVCFQKEMGLRANTFYRRLKEYERKYINKKEPGYRLQSSFNRASFSFAILQKPKNNLYDTFFCYFNRPWAIEIISQICISLSIFIRGLKLVIPSANKILGISLSIFIRGLKPMK